MLAIVSKLVAENAEAPSRIAARFKTSEKVGKAQLVLFMDALQRGEGEPELDDGDGDGPDELDEADAKLRAAAGIDDKSDGDLDLGRSRPGHRDSRRTERQRRSTCAGSTIRSWCRLPAVRCRAHASGTRRPK